MTSKLVLVCGKLRALVLHRGFLFNKIEFVNLINNGIH